MRDFSIDVQAEKIHSAKTRDYFNEVVKSYYGESYRSAVVMLYSIVIADLIYKLEDLKDLFDDTSAKEILSEIEVMQTRNPNSPEWETKLIELIKSKTNLMEAPDHLHLSMLQKHRHLCAHPVMTQNFELYNPNKETVRSHIRNMLEGVLTKAPLLSRKILDDFLTNLASIKNVIHDRKQLERHLESRYLKNLSIRTIGQIFRSLWKITFKVNSVQSNENREVNLKAIMILLRLYYNDLVNNITTEKDFYSDFDKVNLTSLIELFNEFPAVFGQLNESATIVISNTIKKDADLDSLAIFLSPDIETHILKVVAINYWNGNYDDNLVRVKPIIATFKYALNEGKRDSAYNFLIDMFGKSPQYAYADSRFENLISPYITEFTKEELIKIVEKIDGNSQIHERRRAYQSNDKIREQLDKLSNNTFDYSPYENFTRR